MYKHLTMFKRISTLASQENKKSCTHSNTHTNSNNRDMTTLQKVTEIICLLNISTIAMYKNIDRVRIFNISFFHIHLNNNLTKFNKVITFIYLVVNKKCSV